MKTKLTILFAALLMLCGCEQLEEKHKEPPEHCEILCDGKGHFTVAMDGGRSFLYHPIYDTRQGAIDRAWRSYTPQAKDDPDSVDSYNWHVCREETK